MTLPPGVRLKLDRARKHLADLESGVRAYLDSEPFTLEAVGAPDHGPLEYVVRVREDTPAELGLSLGDALHNARSALDHLACRLVEHGGGEVTRRTQFPASDKAEKYRSAVRDSLRGATPEAIAAVVAVALHPGGNSLLWALHRLDIEDKHKILLPVGMSIQSLNLHADMMGGPELREMFAGFPPISLRPHPQEIEFPIVDGTVAFRVLEGARFDAQGNRVDGPAFSVSFAMALDPAMSRYLNPDGHPANAVEATRLLIDHAEKVLTGLSPLLG